MMNNFLQYGSGQISINRIGGTDGTQITLVAQPQDDGVDTIQLYGFPEGTIVDWGDENIVEWNDENLGSLSHSYSDYNEHIVRISIGRQTENSGHFGIEGCVTQVSSWSIDLPCESISFDNSSQLVSVPNFLPSNITSTSYMFYAATSFNQDLSSWDVSNVTNMIGMFEGATSFDQDLSSWNVSNVTDMTHLFFEATLFNQDLSSWEVSNVTDMGSMFCGATSFNQDLSEWEVSNVTDMLSMFYGATSFNQDLSSWDVSNLKDMSGWVEGTPIEDKAKMWFPELYI